MGHRAQAGDLVVDHFPTARNFFKIEPEHHSGDQEPRECEEDDDERNAQHHPLDETDFRVELLADVAGDDGVRRAAQQRAQAPDRC